MPSTQPESRKPAAESPSPATAPGAGAAPPSSPEPSQAALDAQAAELQAKVDAEAKRLADLEPAARKAEEKAEDHGQPRAVRCREDGCRERMERYTGSNPHKIGTHWCPVHGRMTI
jgi:hypothetical protein